MSESSSSESWAGRYRSSTFASACSRSADSPRPAPANASAASRRFFASLVRTASTSSSESSRACLPATSAVRTAAMAMRRVEVTSSSRDFIASRRSVSSRSLRVLMGSHRTLVSMRFSKVMAGLAVAGAATFAYASLVERNMFTLRRFDVPILPPDAEPLRVLHLSDLHLMPGQLRKQDWVADLAGLDPDLVVVTGDNISHPEAVPAVERAYGTLFELPGAFVFGSNDYRGPVFKNPFGYFNRDREYVQGRELPTETLRTLLVDAGWADLNNARTVLKAGGRTVELVGVDDPHVQRDRY